MIIYRKLTLAAILAFAATMTSAPAASAADRWVKIVNHTSVVVYRWYASSVNSDSWGQDRLVTKQIPPNYTSTIDLNTARGGCYFDFRAEFKDGDVLEKYGVDVCGGFVITYTE